jgi:hypothetical protein
MEPEARMLCLRPHSSNLTMLVITPNVTDTICNLITKVISCCRAHVLMPCCEDDLVGFEFRSICEAQAVRQDFFDLLALLCLDLSVDDELRAAHVNVVTTTALKVLHE